MRGFQAFTITAGLFSICCEALVLRERTDNPRVVGLPIQKRQVTDPIARDQLRRRAKTVGVTLDNEGSLYFANATLGTPPQSLRLHIDTGSSDLWVNTPQSTLCRSRGNQCAFAGTYAANSSSTYSYISSDFNITYADNSGASGDYATDKFVISGSTLNSLQFGIGYQSTSVEGILGVGYQSNEVQVGRLGKQTYANAPAAMVADGLISSNAYSLWLDDLQANTGSILFGGVDTEKFHGTLATLPVQQISGEYAEFLITLTSLSFAGTSIASNQAQAVLLDSGTTLTYLPNSMASAIYQVVNAQYDSGTGEAYVSCSLASNTSTLDYTFSSPTISIPMSELVLPAYFPNGQPLTFSDNTPACTFGIAPAGSSTAILGDTFLRSAYVVYDLANNQISIAQTNFNATNSNVLEIGTGQSAVPSATAVQNPVAASGVSGGATVGGGTATLGATVTATPTLKSTAVGRPAASLGAVVAIGVSMMFLAC